MSDSEVITVMVRVKVKLTHSGYNPAPNPQEVQQLLADRVSAFLYPVGMQVVIAEAYLLSESK